MKHSVLRWLLITLCAAIGIGIGAAAANALAPDHTRYRASATVSLLPAPDLSITDASAFWEVLSGGQINRTLAIVYGQQARWLPAAATAADVPQWALTLTAVAVPESAMATVTVEGPSAAASTSALKSVLAQAQPQAAELSVPFIIRVIDPDADAVKVGAPSRQQLVAAGALGGGIAGVGLAWLILRLRARRSVDTVAPADGDPESS